MPTKEPRFHGEVTEKSHKNMSRIRGKDTSIEVVLRKALWHRGFRYRKNYKELPGRPDIVLTKYRIAIFCDSEFFHGKDWEILKPRLEKGKNPDYWVKKIERNIPSRSFTTRSAISLMASLCVTMTMVLPYFWFTVSISFRISLEVL